MILKDLLNSLTNNDIIARLHTLYYNDEPDYDFTGYCHVLTTLRALEPIPSDFSIVAEIAEDDDDGEYYSWVHIYGTIDGSSEHWALEFRPWNEWLGSIISNRSFNYTPVDVMTYCLWEMTFMGYEEEKIQGTWNEILDAKKDVEEHGVENTCKLLEESADEMEAIDVDDRALWMM